MSATIPFHNTTGLTGRRLIAASRVAKGQEAAVLDVFRAAGRPLSPSEVHARMPGRVLLTSVRRAISNLTQAGALVKLDQTVPGPYSMPEHLWALPAGQLDLFVGRPAA